MVGARTAGLFVLFSAFIYSIGFKDDDGWRLFYFKNQTAGHNLVEIFMRTISPIGQHIAKYPDWRHPTVQAWLKEKRGPDPARDMCFLLKPLGLGLPSDLCTTEFKGKVEQIEVQLPSSDPNRTIRTLCFLPTETEMDTERKAPLMSAGGDAFLHRDPWRPVISHLGTRCQRSDVVR